MADSGESIREQVLMLLGKGLISLLVMRRKSDNEAVLEKYTDSYTKLPLCLKVMGAFGEGLCNIILSLGCMCPLSYRFCKSPPIPRWGSGA